MSASLLRLRLRLTAFQTCLMQFLGLCKIVWDIAEGGKANNSMGWRGLFFFPRLQHLIKYLLFFFLRMFRVIHHHLPLLSPSLTLHTFRMTAGNAAKQHKRERHAHKSNKVQIDEELSTTSFYPIFSPTPRTLYYCTTGVLNLWLNCSGQTWVRFRQVKDVLATFWF